VKRIALAKQAPHPWPFSHGLVIEGPARLVFLAGQVAFDRHGPARQLVGLGDPAAQTRQVIENIRTLVRQAGGELSDVVEMTVYVTDAGIMEAAGRVAQAYFGDPPPAQSFIVVRALARPELLIEIRAIAAIAPRRRGQRSRTSRARLARGASRRSNGGGSRPRPRRPRPR
jgi:enamine deaminase RidA (YjgF/YER057c/UK114 family)